MRSSEKKQSSPGMEVADPGRRQVLRRITTAALVAGAVGAGTFALYDDQEPVRGGQRKEKKFRIREHQAAVPAATPKLVIARGTDPAKNIEAALTRIGGINLFVGKGDIVLIKPNVGWDRTPEQAANTNPQIVGTLVRSCLSAGAAQVLVADHSVNDAERCFVRSGIFEAVRNAGGKIVLPGPSRFHLVEIPGKLGTWPVLEPFILATKIINVPIVKHHSLTQATIGLKNWYGILGGRRNQLHQRIDDSIVELAALMRPTLTVIDATRLLMRNGPNGGNLTDVKQNDAILVGLDPIAADAWGAAQLGLDPFKLSWLKLGEQKELGLIDYRNLNPIEIVTG